MIFTAKFVIQQAYRWEYNNTASEKEFPQQQKIPQIQAILFVVITILINQKIIIQ